MKTEIEEKLIYLASKHKDLLASFKTNPNYHYKNPSDLSDLYDDCINELMLIDGIGDKSIKWEFPVDKGKNYQYRSDLSLPATHLISFNNLYPNIVIKLYDDGILDFNCDAFGDIVINLFRYKKYYKDQFKSSDTWLLTKLLINWTYGKLGSDKSTYSISPFRMISLYTKGYFDTLIEMCPKSIIKIDCDEIYIKDYDNDYVKNCIHHILNKLNMPYTIDKL